MYTCRSSSHLLIGRPLASIAMGSVAGAHGTGILDGAQA